MAHLRRGTNGGLAEARAPSCGNEGPMGLVVAAGAGHCAACRSPYAIVGRIWRPPPAGADAVIADEDGRRAYETRCPTVLDRQISCRRAPSSTEEFRTALWPRAWPRRERHQGRARWLPGTSLSGSRCPGEDAWCIACARMSAAVVAGSTTSSSLRHVPPRRRNRTRRHQRGRHSPGPSLSRPDPSGQLAFTSPAHRHDLGGRVTASVFDGA